MPCCWKGFSAQWLRHFFQRAVSDPVHPRHPHLSPLPSRKRGCAALLAQYLVQPSRDLCDHRLLAQPDVDADDLGVGCVPRCGDCGVAVAEFFDEPRGVFTTGEAETRALERHAINTWNPPTNRR